MTGRQAAASVVRQLLLMVIVMGTAGFIVPPLYNLAVGKEDPVNGMIVASAVYSVVLLYVFIRKKWWSIPSENDFVRTKPWSLLLWSLLVGFGWLIPMSAFDELLPDMPNVVGDEMTALMNNDFGFFTLCLFAPFIEEVMFRGGILRTLLPVMPSRWQAIALSALLFALIHMNPAQMPSAFIAGLFLGWIYSRTGSILPGVIYHWVNNTTVFVMCRLMPQFANSGISEVFGGDHRRMALAVVFSLFILLPSLYQLSVRTRKDR